VTGVGISNELTICGTRNVLDNAWHPHCRAAQRSTAGLISMWTGRLDAQGTGGTGDVSYPD